MNKNNIKKIIIISTVILVLFIVVGFSGYKYNRMQIYNNLISSANGYMKSKNYDEVIALYNQSLNYKNDSSTNKQINVYREKFNLNRL